MADHLFLCGLSLAQRADYDGGTRLIVNGPEANILLKVEDIRRKYLADLPDALTDFLEIATYVFAADNTVSRGGPAFRNMGEDWRRSFLLVIAVREPAHWTAPDVLHALCGLLGFISDDSWQFKFVPRQDPPEGTSYFDLRDHNEEPGASNVVLFSGGLDSLAGAVQELRQGNQRIVLVSHKASSLAVNR